MSTFKQCVSDHLRLVPNPFELLSYRLDDLHWSSDENKLVRNWIHNIVDKNWEPLIAVLAVRIAIFVRKQLKGKQKI